MKKNNFRRDRVLEALTRQKDVNICFLEKSNFYSFEKKGAKKVYLGKDRFYSAIDRVIESGEVSCSFPYSYELDRVGPPNCQDYYHWENNVLMWIGKLNFYLKLGEGDLLLDYELIKEREEWTGY